MLADPRHDWPAGLQGGRKRQRRDAEGKRASLLRERKPKCQPCNKRRRGVTEYSRPRPRPAFSRSTFPPRNTSSRGRGRGRKGGGAARSGLCQRRQDLRRSICPWGSVVARGGRFCFFFWRQCTPSTVFRRASLTKIWQMGGVAPCQFCQDNPRDLQLQPDQVTMKVVRSPIQIGVVVVWPTPTALDPLAAKQRDERADGGIGWVGAAATTSCGADGGSQQEEGDSKSATRPGFFV